MAYYGVYIISNEKKNTLCDDDPLLVFDDKNEAFKYLKKNRESRLKCFDTYEQAEHFAKCGLESTMSADVLIPVFDSNGKQNSDSNGNTNNCDKATTTTTTPKTIGEKPSSFRAPTSQELVKFRKLIEQGDIENVHKTVWSNPRYLVSSGDTPTILKESFRYNGLHVASIAKNAEICALILDTVGDPKFISLYHGRDDHRTAEEVSTILLDLYLNTPEKGRGETALHLASKFGAVSVVETLTSYQECQMNRNIEGMLPKDIICSRNEAAGGEVVQAIRTLLEGRFYVPVIRSVDNSMPPVIGEAFAETQLPETNIGDDLLSPKMEIRAIAGPMNKEQAETFRKRWKTPPRTLSSPAASYLKSPPLEGSPLNGSPLSSYPSCLIRHSCTPKRMTNGGDTPVIEKMSRRLFDANGNDENNELDVPAHTINIPTNMNSAKKNLFRNYRDQSHEDSLNESLITDNMLSNVNDTSIYESPYSLPGFRERNLKLADVDKGLEVIGRGLAKENKIVWREHWSFLNEFVNIGTHDGLTKFERYLQDRLDERMKPPMFKMCQTSQPNIAATPVSKICNKLTKLNLFKNLTPNHDQHQQARSSTPSSPIAFHAYLCVEKSFQIFAKRLLKPIAENPNNIATINDVLHGELTRLKSLICSYKNDIRFFGIDFSATHSRFAHMVIAFLKESDDDQVIPIFEQTIKQISQTKEKALQNAIKNGMHDQIKNTSQFICLLEQLLRRLMNSNHLIFPEILTTEKECSEIWHDEYKCDCEWANVGDGKQSRNIKRKPGSSQRTSESFADFCAQINEINLNGDDDTMDDNNDDDDVFMSLDNSDDEFYGSDSDEFFTPPQSPLQEMLDATGTKFEYDNFIYGFEPTKMDNDVLKALHDVEIDKNNYPNVYCWYNALMKYSLEERSRFPQPQHSSRTLTISFPSPLKSSGSTLQSKTFSRTPIKDILPKPNQYLLKPSKFSTKD